MRNSLFQLFKHVVKLFIGKGYGNNHIIGWAYRCLSKKIVPRGEYIVNLDGYKLMVHTDAYKGIDGLSQRLIFEKIYEPQTTNLFKQYIRPGMTVMDIGANIGYYSLLASQLVMDIGCVYAFEPEPRNYDALLHNITLNKSKNIIPLRMIVSNRCGMCRLYIDTTEPGAHSIHDIRDSFKESIAVCATTLDQIVSDAGVHKVDFIKIDVEGAELNVLQGMQDITKRNNKLILVMELWPYGLQKSGTELNMIWDELLQLGFKRIHIIDEVLREVVQVNLSDIKQRKSLWKGKEGASVNLLCLKD